MSPRVTPSEIYQMAFFFPTSTRRLFRPAPLLSCHSVHAGRSLYGKKAFSKSTIKRCSECADDSLLHAIQLISLCKRVTRGNGEFSASVFVQLVPTDVKKSKNRWHRGTGARALCKPHLPVELDDFSAGVRPATPFSAARASVSGSS